MVFIKPEHSFFLEMKSRQVYLSSGNRSAKLVGNHVNIISQATVFPRKPNEIFPRFFSLSPNCLSLRDNHHSCFGRNLVKEVMMSSGKPTPLVTSDTDRLSPTVAGGRIYTFLLNSDCDQMGKGTEMGFFCGNGLSGSGDDISQVASWVSGLPVDTAEHPVAGELCEH